MNRFNITRYLSIVRKEIIQIKRDRPSLVIALAMPILMLTLFGYAVNTDVEHIKTTVWDQSHTFHSRELIQQFTNTQYFDVVSYAGSYHEIEKDIDNGSADVGLVIPPDYGNKRDNNDTVSVQMLINGSDPSIARTASANAQLIVQNKAFAIQEKKLQRLGMGEMEMPVKLESRVLFNPNMESIMFNIPGLIGIIMQNVTMILTAFSLVREKERGTMEQLIVTPIRPLELMMGKITPYIFVGLVSFSIVLLLGIYWFGVPLKGSLPLLMCLSLLFLVTTLSLGIVFSTIAKTQLQAMQMTFAFILPSVLLSGFMFPRETMPTVIQWLGGIIPLTYYLGILRGIFLKGIDLTSLWADTIGLMTFFIVTVLIAILRFRKKIE